MSTGPACSKTEHENGSQPCGASPPGPASETVSPVTGRYRAAYTPAVRRIREYSAAGEVCQANLCQVLSAPVAPEADVDALTALPAPWPPGTVRRNDPAARAPGEDRHCVPGAVPSPRGRIVESGRSWAPDGPRRTCWRPAENVVIVDPVRNDLGRVCATGNVTVPELCAVEQHPGLVHLVSTVRGELLPGAGRPAFLAAALPPGSVTGAPGRTLSGPSTNWRRSRAPALRRRRPGPRRPGRGRSGRRYPHLLDRLRRGAAPPRYRRRHHWGFESDREWRETDLKASRLPAVASARRTPMDARPTP